MVVRVSVLQGHKEELYWCDTWTRHVRLFPPGILLGLFHRDHSQSGSTPLFCSVVHSIQTKQKKKKKKAQKKGTLGQATWLTPTMATNKGLFQMVPGKLVSPQKLNLGISSTLGKEKKKHICESDGGQISSSRSNVHLCCPG